MSLEDSQADVLDDVAAEEPAKVPAMTTEEKIIDRFCQAYKAVFGVSPTIRQTGQYYYITGYSGGMTIARVRQLYYNLKGRIPKAE